MTDLKSKDYKCFADFYPFYLSQHKSKACRRLHFIGSLLIILLVFYVLYSANWPLLYLLPVVGYSFAWAGHFIFEKNTPATFTYPIYSLMADWVMFKDIIIGKIKC